MFQSSLDRDKSDEDLERVDGCYKLLLDAGSDISSVNKYDPDLDGAWESAFYLALYKGTLVRPPYRDSVEGMQLIIFRPN